MPIRIQRRRARGWRLPAGAVCVDRSTPWGNPFVVGRDGTAAECVALHRHLLSGLICLSAKATIDEQTKCLTHAREHIHELIGRDVACWCGEGAPCHGTNLLEAAAKRERDRAWPDPGMPRLLAGDERDAD